MGPWARQADGVPSRDAKDVEGVGGVPSPPHPIKEYSIEEYRKLPQRVRGRARPKTVWVNFQLERTHVVATNCLEYGNTVTTCNVPVLQRLPFVFVHDL